MTAEATIDLLGMIWKVVLVALMRACWVKDSPAMVVAAGGGGEWALLQRSIGISAMHMQLQHSDRVVIFDRTDFGTSQLQLPGRECRNDAKELVVKHDCTAHSAEYNVLTNSFRALFIETDTWCSSGSVMPDGTLYQTGGFNDGAQVVRVYAACFAETCEWQEIDNGLAEPRWYASNHALPGARQIIVGGLNQFNYEFYPKTSTTNTAFNLPDLEDSLYPLVFLTPDGNLFIFSNNLGFLFNYQSGTIVRTYPSIPDGNPRSYPSTGSGVMLPLKNLVGIPYVEVLVCGGAPGDSYTQAQNGNFVAALNTCARLNISDSNPQWIMETMPTPRVMGDMLILPNGQVLIINGAGSGTAGWEFGRDPVVTPALYNPDAKLGARFQVLAPADRPRMYHSTAIVLRDTRVLVGGSNPHQYYNFTNVLFPTDLSLEAFSPSYLDQQYNAIRPEITAPVSGSQIGYNKNLVVQFRVTGELKASEVSVTLYSPTFTTHAISMNQRMVVLGGSRNVKSIGKSTYQTIVPTPTNQNMAPSGYYIVFVVHQNIPGPGVWVHLVTS